MSPEREFDLLEDAIYESLHYSIDPETGHKLTARAIATAINVPYSTLSDAANQERPQPFHALWIVPLIKSTGNFAIVRFIARAVGGFFFLPKRRASHDSHKATTFKEIADYIGALAKHDGQPMTHAVVDDIENEMHDVISCMLSHLDKLRSEAK